MALPAFDTSFASLSAEAIAAALNKRGYKSVTAKMVKNWMYVLILIRAAIAYYVLSRSRKNVGDPLSWLGGLGLAESAYALWMVYNS